MIHYQRETIDEVRQDIIPLLSGNHSQTLESDLPVDPDWDVYKIVENEKRFFMLTARIDGKLVGYNAMFLVNHIHSKECKVAQCDAIYVLPEYRKFKVGIKLIKFFEKTVKSLGFHKIYYNAPINSTFDKLLGHLGYDAVEIVRTKNIKGNQ